VGISNVEQGMLNDEGREEPQSRKGPKNRKGFPGKTISLWLFSFQPVNLSTFQPSFPAVKSGHFRSNRTNTAKTDRVVLNCRGFLKTCSYKI
jgi:hypothetical protein